MAMSGQIFISYRHDDSSTWAGRLYDRLCSHFVSNQIFMDVDAIEPGVDFVEAIEKSVGSCELLIAVIGKRWLISSDEKGGHGLENPEDFVRLEIATALKRGTRVIPVLVGSASMPRYGDLPDELKSLARFPTLTVSQDRFRSDLERLIKAMERALESARIEKQQHERERAEQHEGDAQTLYAKGDLAGARRLQEQALEVRARLLGKEHPDTLRAMNNLAQTLYAQGDLAGARELQEQALEARARLLGKEHPDTLRAMNNLAQTLYAQGDLAGARKLQEQVLEARVRLQMRLGTKIEGKCSDFLRDQ